MADTQDDVQNRSPDDFASTLEQLESLVNQLESGDLSLEASLTAFERGIRLTREAQRRLGEAELKVRTLVEQPDGSIDEVSFDSTSSAASSGAAMHWEVDNE
ncbi:exodeoxyribonuclease VII small subunit [Halomonas sp. GXIMD04776]|uniref:exodeoxyribonuclease VII small subunit n=1 Tax=Halomonas sp. GXIMD04776 TaxID=3415605 RepID=UPI003CC4862C